MYLTIHQPLQIIHQSKIHQLKQIPRSLQTIIRIPQLSQIIIRAQQISHNKPNNKIVAALKIPAAPKTTMLQQIKVMLMSLSH
jgi:hypothetical protein